MFRAISRLRTRGWTSRLPRGVSTAKWRRRSSTLETSWRWSLSGRDLLAAERIVADYRKRLSERLKQQGEVARKALFSDGSAPSASSVAGCAEDRWLAGCEAARGRSDSAKACRGEFPDVDAPPVDGGQSASLHVPRQHVPGALANETKTVTYALHIGASGFVCRAALVEGSTNINADQTTLQTVTRWQFRPATSGGAPVESLYVGRLSWVRDP